MSISRGPGDPVLMLPAGFRVGDFLYLADDDQEAEAVSGAPVALLPGDPALSCAKAMHIGGIRGTYRLHWLYR